MIFKPELAQLVVEGRKTATRRRMSDNPRSPWHEANGSYPVGMDFAVQPGRAKKAIGRTRVTDRYIARLGLMVEADALKEGFRPEGSASALAAFDEAWETINGYYDEEELVHVVEFELLEHEALNRGAA